MRRNGLLLLVIVLVIVVALLATGTMSIRCNSNEPSMPESIEEAGDRIKDAAEKLTDG